DPDAAEGLAAVADRRGAVVLTLGADRGGSLGARSAGLVSAHGVVACGPDDLAALLYTSGTTGRSKGAMLTHANLVSNAQTLARTWHFSASDVLLHALPIFHTHGLFVAVNTCLAAGARLIFQPGFDPRAVFDAMPRATVMMGVPTFYTRLLADPRLDRQAVAHMRLFVSGSAPLLTETHEQFEQRTDHRILERYGMTETNMNSSNPYDGERRAGTVGQPLPDVEIRITDAADGTLSPVGKIGMIEVRGPNVFAGYWRMPEKTMTELRPDGWFITGDLGQFSADGYLAIVGRQKDLIISAGCNIYPKEIELLIDEQQGVVESAVFGVAHADLGEAVAAAVVVDPAAGLDAEAILAGLRSRIARFKQPRQVKIVEALPRNAMGKVQKNLLREQFSS
ncbi:MAG: AMP-binding protein, partial [Sphingomicrobium sp.]